MMLVAPLPAWPGGNDPSPEARSSNRSGGIDVLRHSLEVDVRTQPDVRAMRSADLDDLELEDAARDRDLDLVADLLADEALADRAGEEDLVLVVVFLAGADQDEVFFLVEVEVEDADLRSRRRRGRWACWTCRR